MYQAYYGLSSRPFQLNPDPNFYFGSTQHRRARAYLEYGVHRNEGFIVVTGEVGAGKTTIVRALLASLDPSKVVAAHLMTTQLDADDTLRMVGAAFGVHVKSLNKSELLMALEAWLVQQCAQGRRCLLVVDEAQNLTPRAVEELRMLSNFQYGQQSLLQTFLVGQPEFRNLLQSPAMQQLCQRVTATCHIGPLDADQTQGYIAHRLHCAGSTDRPRFDASAQQAIYSASGGIPRRINQVCDRLLLFGFLAGKTSFVASDVQEVTTELSAELQSAGGARVAASAGAAGAAGGSSGATGTGTTGSGATGSGTTSSSGATPSGAAGGANAAGAPAGAALGAASPAQGQAMAQQINSLGVDQIDARLRRLEGSMLRLEHLNLQLLQLLQKLVVNVPQGQHVPQVPPAPQIPPAPPLPQVPPVAHEEAP